MKWQTVRSLFFICCFLCGRSDAYSEGALLDSAKNLMSEQKNAEALLMLQQKLQEAKDTQPEPAWAGEAFALIGTIFAERQDFPEAATAFRQALQRMPENKDVQNAYAAALIHVQRYDLALKILLQHEKSGDLSPDDKVALIKSLVHTGAFQQAIDRSLLWLAEEPPLPLVLQVKLARLLYIAKDQGLIHKVLGRLPEKRSVEVDEQLFEFSQELGKYTETAKIVDSVRPFLEKTSAGLMQLANYEYRLSHVDAALTLAKKALEKNPSNKNALNFILAQHKDSQLLQAQLESDGKLLEKDPSQISVKIQYARDLIEKTVREALNNKTRVAHSSYLSKAYGQLNYLTRKYPEFPEPFFLLGQTLYLTDQIEDSIMAYENALALDRSFTEAYKYLSIIYQDQNQWDKALEALQLAIGFAPWDAEAWNLVSRIFHMQNNNLDASDALKQALRYRPNDIQLLVELGRLQIQLSDLESAEVTLEKALHLAPDNIEALQLILQLLHDPIFIIDFQDQEKLKEKQQFYYDRLNKIDPVSAKKIKKVMTEDIR
jgi:tetratricopeptide (TPR) repeat protein